MSNILVLDDDSEIVMMIGSYLSQQQDNKVICSYDLDTAYKIIEHRPLDLVITDFQLIGRTSEEFMRTIRKYTKIPIILMSGEYQEEHYHLLEQKVIQKYLQKPFLMHDLDNAIKSCLR